MIYILKLKEGNMVGVEAYSTYKPEYTYSLLITRALVYGGETTTDTGNIALGKPTSESSNAGATNNYYKVVDGNIDTYWGASNYSVNPWVCVDLEDVYELSSINVINYYAGNNRYYNYDIYTSIDGEEFTYLDSYNGTENATSDGIKFDLTESTVYARYVILIIHMQDTLKLLVHIIPPIHSSIFQK